MLNRRNLFKLALGAAAALAVKPLAALAPSVPPIKSGPLKIDLIANTAPFSEPRPMVTLRGGPFKCGDAPVANGSIVLRAYTGAVMYRFDLDADGNLKSHPKVLGTTSYHVRIFSGPHGSGSLVDTQLWFIGPSLPHVDAFLLNRDDIYRIFGASQFF